MRLLKNLVPYLTARTWSRRFAQVYDIKIVEVQHGERERGRDTGEGVKKGDVQRNVFSHPLPLHSTRPLTGFLRTGSCESPPSDTGNHSIAAIVSEEFLDFSASRGNDLRQAAGLTGGCKWCLCVSRWREAFEVRNGDADPKVPRVVLRCTNERALEEVRLEDLRRFAVDADPDAHAGAGAGAGGDGGVSRES